MKVSLDSWLEVVLSPKLIIALIHSVRNRKKILSKNINFNATQNKVRETFPTLLYYIILLFVIFTVYMEKRGFTCKNTTFLHWHIFTAAKNINLLWF